MNTLESPEQAAQRLAAKKVRDEGYTLQALHTYTAADGSPLYWRIRLKNMTTGEKWLRPLSLVDEKYSLKEPVFDEGKPLYRLYELALRPTEPVWLVEGEWCADGLAKLGVLVTTSGAANSVSKAHWQPLAGRTVWIWPDNDEAGAGYAKAAKALLQGLGCAVFVVDVAALGLPSKGDAMDWLETRVETCLETTAMDIFALPVVVAETTAESASAGDEKEKVSQASQLVTFVEAHAELFHDQNGDVYAHEKNSRTTWRIESRAFKDWLQAMFFGATGKSVRDQSFREALSTMAGRGRIQGECRDVYVRVAMLDDCYFLDLGEKSKASIVKIRAEIGKSSVMRR